MNRALPILNLLNCPAQNRSVFGRLTLFALISCFVLIANPSFYSHDELTKLDYIQKNGFAQYLSSFISLKPHADFAFGVRPVSYFVEGVVSLFLPEYPFMVHLVDVLMHAMVAILLFLVLVRLQVGRRVAWLSALVFVISPLAAFSVGWSGALMDRLYMLFGLLAFLQADKYIRRQGGAKTLAGLFAASVLAVLSKETALVFSLALVVYPLFFSVKWSDRRLWVAFFAQLAVALLLMGYRLPELIASFSGTAPSSHYAAGFSNVPENIFAYFMYPFMPFLTESHNWELYSPAFIGIAVIAHIVLLAMLWLTFSYRAVLAYLGGYLLFLLPVVVLPGTGSHYLYGSGIAFGIAIGALAGIPGKLGQRTVAGLVVVLLALATWHTLVNQLFFYKTGTCMSRLSSTMESAYYAEGNPDTMRFAADPASPAYVLVRFIHDRDMVGKNYPVHLQLIDWNKTAEVKDGNYYIFDCECLIHRPEPFVVKTGNWGPQTLALNEVPNRQPDGNGAFWFMVSNTKDLGEVQVIIGGQPALSTLVQEKVVTAAFPPALFAQPGEKDVIIRQMGTGKEFRVGQLNIK